jgi:hypothetical protein
MSESSNKKKANKYLSQELSSYKSIREALLERLEAYDFSYIDELLFLEQTASDKLDYSKYLITEEYKTLLKRMQIMLYNRICTVKKHAYDLFGYISLLFGLCSSQSSNIFRAFFGASLSRIPSL